MAQEKRRREFFGWQGNLKVGKQPKSRDAIADLIPKATGSVKEAVQLTY